MKKIVSALLAGIMLIPASCMSTMANDAMTAKWYTDYTDNKTPKLYVEFTTPAKYTQQITAVLYQYGKEADSDEYIRIEEVTANGERNKLVFSVTDSFSAEDGKYTLSLRGNGYLSEESKLDETVYILNPSKITGTSGVLNSVNSADSASISTVIANLSDALQLENEDDSERMEKRLAAILKMRSADFGGSFKTLEDVRSSWDVTDVIVYTSENPDAQTLKMKIEAAKNSAEIDTDSADFKKYEDGVYAEIMTNGSSYNNGKGIQCCSDLRNIVYKYIAKNVINDSSQPEMEENVMKYVSYIGISQSYIDKYNDLSNTQREKVMRQLYSKNFKNTDAILDAVTYAIDNPPEAAQQKPSSGGGGGGGSKNYAISPSFAETSSAQKTAEFSDCGENHWAYSYVKTLTEKGIVSGYSDGSFNPSKAVSREEFVKMVICAAGLYDKNAVCSFEDVAADSWMYSYVASAVNNGIINGVSGNLFGTGSAVTREDAAVISARILEKSGKNSFVYENASSFSDFDTVSDYAKEKVSLLSGMKILNGFEDNSYRPKESLSRAEAAKIICMITENI